MSSPTCGTKTSGCKPDPALPGVRSLIRIHAERVADSCGFGVPLMDHAGERDDLTRWASTKGPDGVADDRRKKNVKSLEGLPGVQEAA